MRPGAVAFVLASGFRIVAFSSEEASPEAASNGILTSIRDCAKEPQEEGERLSQSGMAILESGEGRLDEAVRSLEGAKGAFERAVRCLALSPEVEARLLDQDREFLGSVRETMREGLERLGSVRQMALSDGIVFDYLARCKEGSSGSPRAVFTKAVTVRGRKGTTDAEVIELFDHAAARIDAFDVCLDSAERLSRELSRDVRKVVAKAAKENEELRALVAAALSKDADRR